MEILPNTPTSMPTDALPGTHLYTGQERDADTGLDNFHFRSYASTMGRFLSPDNLPGTVLNPQSFNLYAYVHGNPVNYNDPTGHYAGGLQDRDVSDLGGDDVPLSFAEDDSGGGKSADQPTQALNNSASGNQSTRSASQPGAQEKQQKSSPTAGQQATKAGSDPSSMRLSKAGKDFVAKNEGGDVAKVYLDSNKNATAGIGHKLTASEKKQYKVGDTVPQKTRDAWFGQDSQEAVGAVQDQVTAKLTQSQFDALVDFAFNVGSGGFGNSQLLKDINGGKAGATTITKDFSNWSKGGPGIPARRDAEAALHNTGAY